MWYRKFVRLTALAAAVWMAGNSLTWACDRPGYRPATIVTYEFRQIPVTIWVTRFDGCRDYRVPVTIYRSVQVPVVRSIVPPY